MSTRVKELTVLTVSKATNIYRSYSWLERSVSVVFLKAKMDREVQCLIGIWADEEIQASFESAVICGVGI